MTKMRIYLFQLLLACLALTPMCQAQLGLTCQSFNRNTSYPFSNYLWDANKHTAYPGHGAIGYGFGSCTYSGVGWCDTSCADNSHGYTLFENGQTLENYWLPHVVGAADVSGSSFGTNGHGAACGSQVAVTAIECNLLLSCGLQISITGAINGIGGSVSWPPVTIMNATHQDLTECTAAYAHGGSPILMNFGGGYHVSNADAGVLFNFFDTGMVPVAWPETGSNDGFLVLPDKEGMVTNATEMFGDLTPQPPSAAPNGFLALAQYDTPEKGGNGDGVISREDAIWKDLRVWIDANHNGISEAGELHTLDEMGIESISLKYGESPYIDPNGNAFRYKGSMTSDANHQDRVVTIYDVFLITGPPVTN